MVNKFEKLALAGYVKIAFNSTLTGFSFKKQSKSLTDSNVLS